MILNYLFPLKSTGPINELFICKKLEHTPDPSFQEGILKDPFK